MPLFSVVLADLVLVQGRLCCLLVFMVPIAGCGRHPAETTIRVADSVRVTQPTRFGVNVGMTTYFNDNHILADPLVHGGFAKGRRVTMCQVDAVDDNRISGTDEGLAFGAGDASLTGGTFWVGTGTASGSTGNIIAHDAGWITLSPFPGNLLPGDWIWLRGAFRNAANPPRVQGDTFLNVGDFRIDSRDCQVALAETTAGGRDQAVRIEGAAGGRATLSHYVRLFAGGEYTLSVAVRGEGASWNARLFRPGKDGEESQQLPISGESGVLSASWQQAEIPFRGPTYLGEGESIWRLDVRIELTGATEAFAEIDSVGFESAPATEYGIDKRVAESLADARLGTLRFLGSASAGGLVDDITAQSPGDATWTYYADESNYTLFRAFGVVDQWMALCEDTGAAAWIPVGAANTPEDWYKLISYLAAPAGFDEYSARRAAHGHERPWTDTVTIYLEPGNEWWNRVSPPFYLPDPNALGEVISQLYASARSHPYFDSSRIRLVAGGWATNPDKWTIPLDKATTGHDVVALAPYFPARLGGITSPLEAIEALFAETDAYLRYSGGEMAKGFADLGDAQLAVYEINQHLTDPSVSPELASALCTSYAGALAVTDRALSVMEALQTDPVVFYQLFQRLFRERAGLWGLCMRSNDGEVLPRPLWQMVSLLNQYALDGDMVACTVSNSPTRRQVEVGPVPEMAAVPALHAFGFVSKGEPARAQLVVVNRDLHSTITARIEWPFQPGNELEVVSLLAADPLANNEKGKSVYRVGPERQPFLGYFDAPPLSISILRANSPTPTP